MTTIIMMVIVIPITDDDDDDDDNIDDDYIARLDVDCLLPDLPVALWTLHL